MGQVVKTWIGAVLILLALGWSPVLAQEGTHLKAVADGTIMLYAEPSATALVIADVPDASILILLGTDQTGDWLAVETPVGSGYVIADQAIMLDLPALASRAVIDTPGGTALFAMPDTTIEPVTDLPVGMVVGVLGFNGPFAYVEALRGTGWTPAIDLTMLPDDAVPMRAIRSGVPVFAGIEADAAVIGVLSEDAPVYRLGAGSGNLVKVLAPGGITGYAPDSYLEALPEVYVEAYARTQAGAALYAEPARDVGPVAYLPDGQTAFFLGEISDLFIKLYHPEIGVVYGLASHFSTPYAVVTIGQPRSIVRNGPNDNVYQSIALLNASTRVIATGTSATGAWIEIAMPFDEIDYAYHGVSGWARDFLFVDDFGQTDLDKTILTVTE